MSTSRYVSLAAVATVCACIPPPYYALASRGDATPAPSRRIGEFAAAPTGTAWCADDTERADPTRPPRRRLQLTRSTSGSQWIASDEKGRSIILNAGFSEDLRQIASVGSLRIETAYSARGDSIEVAAPSICQQDDGWLVAWQERATLEREAGTASAVSHAVLSGLERIDGSVSEGVSIAWIVITPQEIIHVPLARILAGRHDAHISGLAIGMTAQRHIVVRLSDEMGAGTTTRYLVSDPLRSARPYGLTFRSE